MTTVATPSGKTVKTYVSSTVVRVKRNDAWHKVDPTLIAENGVVKPRMTTLDIQLSNGGSTTPLLTAKGDSLSIKEGQPGEVSIAAPGKLPVPELSGNTATYRSAYGPQIDLIVTITPGGYQHQIVIRERPSKRLKLPVLIDPPSGMSLGKSSSGKPAALADGKEVADLSKLPILDAKEIASPGTGKTSSATSTLTGSGEDTALVLTPDATFLADPAVTYPVTVVASNPTPWHGAGAPADTFIANGGSYQNGSYMANSNALFAGRRDGYNYRSYLKFNLTGAPFIGRQILDANITLWNYLSSACGNVGDISLHRVASDWTPTTLKWSDQPRAVADGYVVNPYGKDQSCSDWMAEGELWYSIEQIAQAWADGMPNHGVMIRAVAESGANNWRQYLSGNYPETAPDGSHHPYFFVEYEKPTRIRGFLIPYRTSPTVGSVIAHTDIPANDAPAPLISEAEALIQREEASDYVMEDSALGLAPPDDISPEEWLTAIEADKSPQPDATPPSVISTVPSSGQTNVPANISIRADFNEEITGAEITVTDARSNPLAGQMSIDPSGQSLTFAPSSPLVPGGNYTATVTDAKDSTGNGSAPYAWSFTVDNTPASVIETSPADGASEVELAAPIRVTFSEPVADVAFAVKDSSGTPVTGNAGISDDAKVWTFTPGGQLAWNMSYTVEVSAAKDASGNVMAPHTWSFATVTDQVVPTVSETSPTKDATGVPVTTKVKLTFSETVSDAQITVTDAGGAQIPGDITVDTAGRAWALTFGGPLSAETTHTVHVTGARDPAGNLMEPYSWAFTTALSDTTAPTVTESLPAADSVDAALGSPIKAAFSEPVSEGQIVVKDQAGNFVTGSLSADSTTLLSFTPAQPLAERTEYTVEVSGAKDEAGNAMAPHFWSFTTMELPPPPNSPKVSDEYVYPTKTDGAITTLTPS
ncbi:Ig-like domain-containing protein, partial [Planomonospora parontospora]